MGATGLRHPPPRPPGDEMAEPRGLFAEQVGGYERSGEAAEPEENIQKIQRRATVSRVHIAAERVGRGNDDASAGAEQKQIRCDGAKAVGSWQKRDGPSALRVRPKTNPIFLPS